jgi:hypothetical protein
MSKIRELTMSRFILPLRAALVLGAIGACGSEEPAAEGPAHGAQADASAVSAADPAAPADAGLDATAGAGSTLDAGTSGPTRDTAVATPEAAAPQTYDATLPSDASNDAAASVADGGDAGASGDLRAVASGLDALFIDAKCAADTPTPLANGATCLHPANTQHIERVVTLGGDADKTYVITLRVRGIWEPTKIQGGERPDKAHPFTIGGMLPAGTGSSDAVSYQQYSLQVAEPKQVYWLNDHQYLAHAIHKEDYQATIRVRGGAKVTVIMNDGNERQIANFTKDYFQGLPPYDTAPSTGQSLRLDVMAVSLAP